MDDGVRALTPPRCGPSAFFSLLQAGHFLFRLQLLGHLLGHLGLNGLFPLQQLACLALCGRILLLVKMGHVQWMGRLRGGLLLVAEKCS